MPLHSVEGSIPFWRFAAAIAPLLLMSEPAVASSQAERKICGREIRSVCPWRPWRPTPNDITTCVEKKRVRLSPNCQRFWDTANMCQAEIRTVCGGLNPFTLRGCLKKRREEFSQVCQASFDLPENQDGGQSDGAQP